MLVFTKVGEFPEKVQTAFDPPTSFKKCNFFLNMSKFFIYIFLDMTAPLRHLHLH